MPKMMPPGTSIWWIDETDITAKADLFSAATYTGTTPKAVDVSCAVVTGFTLNPTDSDTDDTQSICDAAAVSTPVRENYEASITFFREKVGNTGPGTTSPADKAFGLFRDGIQNGQKSGWLVKRIGWKQDTPVAAGQILSAFKVSPDNPRDEVGDATTAIQFTVPFLPQGEMYLNQTVTA